MMILTSGPPALILVLVLVLVQLGVIPLYPFSFDDDSQSPGFGGEQNSCNE